MADQQDSVAVLRELARRIRSDCAGIGDLEAQCLASLPALDSTIAALQSQQVASADRGEACPRCAGSGAVERSPDHDDGGQVTRPCRKCDGTGKATPPSPAESAAPSGVSDADVERACLAQFGSAWSGASTSHNNKILRDGVRRGLEAAIQPQPGRVEGMVPYKYEVRWPDGVTTYPEATTFNAAQAVRHGAAIIQLYAEAPTASSQEPDHG